MKKMSIGWLVFGVIASVGFLPWSGLADPPLPGNGPDAKTERITSEFRGRVEAIDPIAKTLMVAGKLISISESTKITKAGALIKLDQVMRGDEVRGTSYDTHGGKNEALTLNVGISKDNKDNLAPKEH